MKKSAKNQKFKQQAINLTIAIIILCACYLLQDKFPGALEAVGLLADNAPVEISNDTLYTRYIDVGQGDSTLLHTKNAAMLIDGGEAEHAQQLVEYIQSLGISKIDYLIATHPHSDHIGSLSEIIKNFEIGVVMMPKVSSTTTSYEKLLLAMSSKSLKATVPTPGYMFDMDGVQFMVLGPSSESYENLNNYSIGLKAVYGNHHYVFTADAEKLAEDEMIASGLDLRADFYKAGHHGSKTSSSKKFVDAVNPSHVFISCGYLNDYGHPHAEIMERFRSRNIEVYRTDLLGTIVLESNGDSFRITNEGE